MSESRSRSRSPEADEDRTHSQRIPEDPRAKLEQERKERMKRLRQEMEEETKASQQQYHQSYHLPNPLDSKSSSSARNAIVEIQDSDLQGMDEEEQLKTLLGFGDFSSSKGKKVPDNQNSLARGAAAKNKARKYRQYMNRKGGFNRPLEKMN